MNISLACLCAGILALGCGPADRDDSAGGETDHAAAEDALYYLAGSRWPTRTITVCWGFEGYLADKATVKTALEGPQSWETAGNIDFVGWESCDSGPADIEFHYQPGWQWEATALGDSEGPIVEINLDFDSVPPGDVVSTTQRCSTNGLSRSECITASTLHEIGHALGFAHEQNRPDTPASCTAPAQGDNGDVLVGPWDTESIMSYCNLTSQLSGGDRIGVAQVYGRPKGPTRRLSDFNGDGVDDQMCRNAETDQKLLDSGTNGYDELQDPLDHYWQDTTCQNLMFPGDFNGDGKSDLLCVAPASKTIDYWSTGQGYGGTDVTYANNWCTGSAGQIYVGNFNGDAYDDLLCHSQTSGNFQIDYGPSLTGTNWSSTSPWCNAMSAGLFVDRLYVGDVDGNGRDDLICHNTSTGVTRYDGADVNGAFFGSNWTRPTNAPWCQGHTKEVYVGYFTSDLRADLICHDTKSGSLSLDRAAANPVLGSSIWNANHYFCHSATERLFTGDVNGDGRDDLVCHDFVSGLRAIDWSTSTGTFAGVDANISSPFCNSGIFRLL